MIPPFNDAGLLPPGLHRATLAEIQTRFGSQSEMRKAQAESLEWLVDLCRRAGIRRLVINGSFVTDVIEPNDVDCVLLTTGPSPDQEAQEQLDIGLPFLDIIIVGQDDFDYFTQRFFATDRQDSHKGMIEVIL